MTTPSPSDAAATAWRTSPSPWSSEICGPGSPSTFSARNAGKRPSSGMAATSPAASRVGTACSPFMEIVPPAASRRTGRACARSAGKDADIRAEHSAPWLSWPPPMPTTAEHLADPELLETAWDLSELVDGDEENGVTRQLDQAVERATGFAEEHAGKVAELDAAGLAAAMHELAEINELVGRAGSYASLRFATDTADSTRGALLQLVQERATEIETKLLFFELEWAELDDDRAAELLTADELGFCAHYLRSARRYRPHLLTEPEETILAEKTISAESAWARLFGELVAALRVPVEGQEVPLDGALSRLQDSNRETRRTVAEAVSAALEPGLRTRAFI